MYTRVSIANWEICQAKELLIVHQMPVVCSHNSKYRDN